MEDSQCPIRYAEPRLGAEVGANAHQVLENYAAACTVGQLRQESPAHIFDMDVIRRLYRQDFEKNLSKPDVILFSCHMSRN